MNGSEIIEMIHENAKDGISLSLSSTGVIELSKRLLDMQGVIDETMSVRYALSGSQGKAKHTPGPWGNTNNWTSTGPSCVTMNYAEEGAKDNCPGGYYHGTTRIVADNMVSVALVTADAEDEAAANAALISAAPDLLAALEELRGLFDQFGMLSFVEPEEGSTAWNVEHAIAKAKGGKVDSLA